MGYRLFGGTALAMYINHRASTDFDFFCEDIVLRFELEQFEWLSNASFVGDEGMVDAIVHSPNRDIVLNFVDISRFSDLEPSHPAIPSPKGIPIAHPIDILASKLSALASRREVSDFVDIAAAAEKLRECLFRACDFYVKSPITRERTFIDLAKTLRNYPMQIEHEVSMHVLETIDTLVADLFAQMSKKK